MAKGESVNMTCGDIEKYIKSMAHVDVGFFKDPMGSAESGIPFPFGISIAVPLSRAVINEIDNGPTHTYFAHYRAANALIDSITLRAGLYIASFGYDYIAIPASQTVEKGDGYVKGRYSHKRGAVLAGLGQVGKSNLFIHKNYGPCVRLGTVFCSVDFGEEANECGRLDICGSCMRCVEACPAMAIGHDGGFDPIACSRHMKKNYSLIGRGAVCGICIKVCSKFRK